MFDLGPEVERLDSTRAYQLVARARSGGEAVQERVFTRSSGRPSSPFLHFYDFVHYFDAPPSADGDGGDRMSFDLELRVAGVPIAAAFGRLCDTVQAGRVAVPLTTGDGRRDGLVYVELRRLGAEQERAEQLRRPRWGQVERQERAAALAVKVGGFLADAFAELMKPGAGDDAGFSTPA